MEWKTWTNEWRVYEAYTVIVFIVLYVFPWHCFREADTHSVFHFTHLLAVATVQSWHHVFQHANYEQVTVQVCWMANRTHELKLW